MGLWLLAPSLAHATTFLGGHVTWKPEPGADHRARFSVRAAFQRDAYPGSAADGHPAVGDVFAESVGGARLEFGDGGSTGTLSFRVKSLSLADNWVECVALAGGVEGIVRTYAGPGPFTARLVGGLRPLDLTNAAASPYRVEALVDFGAAPFGSAATTLAPVVDVAFNAINSIPLQLGAAAIDPSANLTVRFASPGEFGSTWSPMTGLGVGKLDATRAVITWNTSLHGTAVVGSRWAIQVIVEDHAGSPSGPLKSRCAIDLVLRVVLPAVDAAPSVAVGPGACGATFLLQAGQAFSVPVSASDNAAATLHATGIAKTMALVPALPASGAAVATTFQWTPQVADSGVHVVGFTARDATGHMTHCSMVLQVTSPPQIALSGGVACGDTKTVQTMTNVSFTVTATDPDAGDVVTLAVSGLPAGAQLAPPLPVAGNPVVAAFTWKPTLGQSGQTFDVTFTATDLAGASRTCTVHYQVGPFNSPAIGMTNGLQCGATQALPAAAPFSFTVSANDADAGDQVTLSATGLPAGASFQPALPQVGNPASATFQWTPTSNQAGPHVITFTAKDLANHPATCSITLDVKPGILPDVTFSNDLSCGTNKGVPAGSSISFAIVASDAEPGDVVTLSATGLPAGATVNPPLPVSGNPAAVTFQWTPTLAQQGLAPTVTFTATDSKNQKKSCAIHMSVGAPGNTAPNVALGGGMFCGIPRTIATGSTVAFTFAVDDDDAGDIVDLTVSGKPAGAVVTPQQAQQPSPVQGSFSWTPTINDIGHHVVTFAVSDDKGNANTCQVVLDVVSQFSMIIGFAPVDVPIGAGGDTLYAMPVAILPVTPGGVPDLFVPFDTSLIGFHVYIQFVMLVTTPGAPDPLRLSNGLDVTIGGPWIPYGTGTGLAAFANKPAKPGGVIDVDFIVN